MESAEAERELPWETGRGFAREADERAPQPLRYDPLETGRGFAREADERDLAWETGRGFAREADERALREMAERAPQPLRYDPLEMGRGFAREVEAERARQSQREAERAAFLQSPAGRAQLLADARVAARVAAADRSGSGEGSDDEVPRAPPRCTLGMRPPPALAEKLLRAYDGTRWLERLLRAHAVAGVGAREIHLLRCSFLLCELLHGSRPAEWPLFPIDLKPAWAELWALAAFAHQLLRPREGMRSDTAEVRAAEGFFERIGRYLEVVYEPPPDSDPNEDDALGFFIKDLHRFMMHDAVLIADVHGHFNADGLSAPAWCQRLFSDSVRHLDLLYGHFHDGFTAYEDYADRVDDDGPVGDPYDVYRYELGPQPAHTVSRAATMLYLCWARSAGEELFCTAETNLTWMEDDLVILAEQRDADNIQNPLNGDEHCIRLGAAIGSFRQADADHLRWVRGVQDALRRLSREGVQAQAAHSDVARAFMLGARPGHSQGAGVSALGSDIMDLIGRTYDVGLWDEAR